MIYHDVEQNTDEWFALRMGKFTASSFKSLFSNTSTAEYKKALYKPVYERLSKSVPESYTNKWMERGHELEDEAALTYEAVKFVKTKPAGFFESNEWVGASPDRLVEDVGLVEIKCVAYNTQIDYILANKLPTIYKEQVYGQLHVTGRKWIDFVSYCPGLPLFVIRIERDEKIIKEIADKLDESIIKAKELLSKLSKL